MKMKRLLAKLKKGAKKGQSLVEYGLILALVSVVAIAVLNTMGQHIRKTVDTVNVELKGAQEKSKTTINLEEDGKPKTP